MSKEKLAYNELYDEIYGLMDEEGYDATLDLMVDDDLKLKKEYEDDLNHSWYCIGNVHYRKSSYDKAILAFRKALKERPDDLQAWHALGNSYSEYGLHQHALRCFATVCEVAPDHHDSRFNLAGIQMDIGDYLEAAQNLELLKERGVDVEQNLNICQEKINLLQKLA